MITIGIGWSLNRDVYTGNGLILAGAVITSIPVFSVLACLCAFVKFGHDSPITAAASICAIVITISAGIFEFVGAILFIAAGATLRDEDKVLAYGVSAGVFGLIAAFTCCFSTIACIGSLDDDDNNRSTPDNEV